MTGQPQVLALPGAGSGGSSWADFAAAVPGTVVRPLADLPSVPVLVDDVLTSETITAQTVLVGASLGAVVALEIARITPVAGLVLIASGLGVKVSDETLAAVTNIGSEALGAIARAGVAPHRSDLHGAREHDLASRPDGVLLRHLTALQQHQPAALADPPPTIVVWGAHDTSVGLGAHLRLAEACRGALRPLPGVGHSAYLEDPAAVASCVESVYLQSLRWRRP